MIYLNIAVEDELSALAIKKLIACFDEKFNIQHVYSNNGFGYLKSNIRGFNEAAKYLSFFILTDLDRYECPPTLIEDWVNFELNQNMIFRIAVREIEAWLLADTKGLSKFFRVSESNFPFNPESISDPKNTIIQLAGKSKLRRIREDIIPIGPGASIGPNYNGCLGEFVLSQWSIKNAMRKSKSLEKAYIKLDEFYPNLDMPKPNKELQSRSFYPVLACPSCLAKFLNEFY